MIKYLSKQNPKKLKGIALVRLDFNTQDAWRLQAAIPTLVFLEKYADKIVVIGHKGRPRGVEKNYSLKKDAEWLGRFLKKKIVFFGEDGLDDQKVKEKINSAPNGSYIVLENLRFNPAEEKNDEDFGKHLSSYGDYFVNDAFAVCHRKNASVTQLPKFLPSYAGLLLEKEIAMLSQLIKNPKKPFIAIVGGGKASDKLGVIKHLKNKVDYFLLGGAPANTLYFLQGGDVGKSLVDRDQEHDKEIKKLLRYKNIVSPIDYQFEKDAILDIGQNTVALYKKYISKARTVLWSGPMGLVERKKFAMGSKAIAQAIIQNKKAISISGGGETVEFLKKNKFDAHFSFISTGGTAMLDFLAGEKLPGIEILRR